MLIQIIIFLLPHNEVKQEQYPESIEYCQNVYWSWNNPLNEKCDMEQVERSLQFNNR